ncbi:hypothetical protein GXB78_15160 [Pseudomonas moraviensis subsp. stanleyae]|uniref:hypothetical protein n=1 Tax=Pseudomonas moraviensis TaxID=321662 RepID=UPI002E35FD58|nr:hypothetical protein [Pseudomonas moraviensis]MED7668539.1 hypothetical protein [Pseudomonas moraviensis subsp. stanleyae]
MIYVQPQPEPDDFDKKVRAKGLAHLKAKGIALNGALPPGTEVAPLWRESLTDLHVAYGGICAYLGMFFERVAGSSVDHFIAKSVSAKDIYEWSNYRLACSTLNSRKRDYSTVLDPFLLAPDLFRLQLSTGHIYPNPRLDAKAMRLIELTIETLSLDDALCRDTRARVYEEYVKYNLDNDYFRSKYPFIWSEARRQGLLKL